MPGHIHSHLYLHHMVPVSENDAGKTLVDYHPTISIQMPVINQIPISIECKDLIAKVDCISFQDHRLKLKEEWGHLWPNFILNSSIKLQREDSILMTQCTLINVVSVIHRNPNTFHDQHVGITYFVLK